MEIVSKMKDIQAEMEDICLDSLFRSKNYIDTINEMITTASIISGGDDKSVFIDMASRIYNSISYSVRSPHEEDN